MDKMAEDSALKSILNSLKSIEDRLSHVETKLQIQTEVVEDETQPVQKVTKPIADDDLEIRLGEYWIPKVAFVAFTIGMGFFLTFPLKGLPVGLPIVFGYLMTVVLLIACKGFKKIICSFFRICCRRQYNNFLSNYLAPSFFWK